MSLVLVDKRPKTDCSGCAACASICPKQCIKMVEDECGFLYPNIDVSVCIQCGLCARTCDEVAQKKEDVLREPKAFGAFAKDEGLRLNSSSGGIFSLIAEKVIEENGIVFGAAFDDDCKCVKHTFAVDKEEIAKFRGSKYLQSQIGDSFKQVKDFLTEGKKVLFSGTPCQIAGLKAYLKSDYNNLICIDIICHGVPSPLIWKKYCNEIENKYNGKIVGVNFRHKRNGWQDYGLMLYLQQQKGLYFTRDENPYIRLFLKDIILRHSCYVCKHKGINRKSDITIADFWGIETVEKAIYDKNGTSLLLVHTDKGLECIQKIKESVVMKAVNTSHAINYNAAGIQSPKRPPGADKFWLEYENLTIEELAKKFAPRSKKIGIKSVIKAVVKNTIIYNIYKRLKGM